MKTKRVVEAVIIGVVVLCAGLALPRPASAETEIEKVEKEIREIEMAIVVCAEEMDSIQPPGINATEEQKARYEKSLTFHEKCIANLEEKLDSFKKLLAELAARLPSAELPREDPETKKLRKKFADWQKRVAESDRRKNEMKARVKQLKKQKRH